MKLFAVLILSAIVAYASATAFAKVQVYKRLIRENSGGKITNPEYVDTDGGLSSRTKLPPIRRRRTTCDPFAFTSVWVTVNHSACATQCLMQGHKGGTCRGGVCHCRD